MTSSSPLITLQRMEVIDLPEVSRLEDLSLPPEERVQREVIDYFVTFANNLSYIALDKDTGAMLGYVVASGAPEGTTAITQDMIKNHYNGNVLCVQSIVIAPHLRHQDVRAVMLTAYLKKITAHTDMTRALLLSKPADVPFYEKLAFVDKGLSPVDYGNDTWHLMCKEL